MVLIAGSENIVIYTDGGSRGNPGPAAIGILIISESGELLERKGEFIGVATNNEAEYTAIIRALEIASKFSSGKLVLFSDSQLVISQLKGTYRVKKEHLQKMLSKVKVLEKKFSNVEYTNIRREDKYIPIVDRLVNDALDKTAGPKKQRWF